MNKPPPTVEQVIKYLNNLDFGTYMIAEFVSEANQEVWREIVIDYCQTHPEVYFTSDMKAIKKIDISDFYDDTKFKNKAA
jgi:hypothetical protein